jgi:hypothetical protein
MHVVISLRVGPAVRSRSKVMKVTAYEGIVENGQIKLPEAVRLPEQSRVYVIVPASEVTPRFQMTSPRLIHPEEASDFAKDVVEEPDDARVR